MSNINIRCTDNTMDTVKRINFWVVENTFVVFIIKPLFVNNCFVAPQNFFTWDLFFISTFIAATCHLDDFLQNNFFTAAVFVTFRGVNKTSHWAATNIIGARRFKKVLLGVPIQEEHRGTFKTWLYTGMYTFKCFFSETLLIFFFEICLRFSTLCVSLCSSYRMHESHARYVRVGRSAIKFPSWQLFRRVSSWVVLSLNFTLSKRILQLGILLEGAL